MYWYEKDYIMRLIHGIAQVLARMLFAEKLPDNGDLLTVMEQDCRQESDYLRQQIDRGQVNSAEERLFDLINTASWDSQQKAALALSFYDYLNKKDDSFLAQANFSREEIAGGLEDAMKALGMEIPEYLHIA